MNISGHVPALKNDKTLVGRDSGKPALISNTTVRVFYESFYTSGLKQLQRQGFDRIAWPLPVMIFCELWFFRADDIPIAASDADNAYTTLQELLGPRTKKHPHYLGVVEDDKQIIDFRVRKMTVPSAIQQGGRLFIWSAKATGDGFNEWDQFKEFYRQYKPQQAQARSVNFDEILTELS